MIEDGVFQCYISWKKIIKLPYNEGGGSGGTLNLTAGPWGSPSGGLEGKTLERS